MTPRVHGNYIGTTSGNIDITSLARGSYNLTLMQGGQARTVRFVKE